MNANPVNLIPMHTKVWTDPLPRRREALWLKEGKVCHWCKCPTRLCDEQVDDQATIEHIIPRYKNGTEEDSNLASACRKCNCRRSYEDSRNMKEGALLGLWPLVKTKTTNNSRVALTGDEKKAIMAGKVPNSMAGVPAVDAVREQRDQALAALDIERQKTAQIREELRLLTKEHNLRETVVRELGEELKRLKEEKSFSRRLRKKLAEWIAPRP